MMATLLHSELFALVSGLTDYAHPDRAPLSAVLGDSSTDTSQNFSEQVYKFIIFRDEHT